MPAAIRQPSVPGCVSVGIVADADIAVGSGEPMSALLLLSILVSLSAPVSMSMPVFIKTEHAH